MLYLGLLKKNIVEFKQPTLTNKEQITQLLLLSEGLHNGCAFSSLIPILQGQSNSILKKGWSNVQIPSDYNKFHEIFEQTGFFSEDVLTFLKISLIGGNITSGIRSAIEFLKMN